ncbi:5-formyltetrahydrofolate cyclo-ligase [Wolfiporia cocos MD-104 SS10]|uniref:5-formyltetrahydrofolate cyclo-ligase n=1 Tax=Wolfiporia cocos (strain MD-104) TaxID=742152 RepID=A0A2H3IZJ5_WOLCO|nr:5-formyltetrahydrofolate cyclo-ligase [Wolfiporia cocos MD-104 SS10]
MASMQGQKSAVRAAVAAKLRLLPQSDIARQSQMAVGRVLAAPFFAQSTNVSCYLSMPAGELETAALVSEILRAGKTLFVPKIDPSARGKMDFLKVYGEDDLSSLSSGLWGIREPEYEWQGQPRLNALDEAAGQLDLILVPGVAFDRSLSRVGHGKGYYDRFISAYTRSKCANAQRKPLLVALALREQILEAGQVPTALHDWKMDVIVGPDGIIMGSA